MPGKDELLISAIIDMAQRLGWRAHHARPLMTTRGWRTPIMGNKGFPDLVLAHPDRGVIFAEVKGIKNLPDAEQEAWRRALTAGGAWWYLWRPADWYDGSIERILRDGPLGERTIVEELGRRLISVEEAMRREGLPITDARSKGTRTHDL